ncbi:unnamed protein product [Mytilus coruscus]|uniref:Uncharacterized protein n=1 Tax=Mytilus coruscus TaxID=42192 RepID=A0A6J8DYP1_MYTCO|nr:unnamed protein product [Mytilus coruscus]
MKTKEAEYAVAPSSSLSPPESPPKSDSSSESPPNSPFKIRKRNRIIRPATKATSQTSSPIEKQQYQTRRDGTHHDNARQYNQKLVSKQKTAHLTPLPVTLPTTPATPTTPRIPQPLRELLLNPTSSIPDSPQPRPLTQLRILPMHLFHDIPESMRLTEDDLSRYSDCGPNPGSFGV